MAEDSFSTRVKRAIKGRFNLSMRRSLQSIALYEANRCLLPRYPTLHTFQRKIALYCTTLDLLQTLDFLTDSNKVEIMFRTLSSRDPLAPDLAWGRMKSITREIKSCILPKIEEIMKSEAGMGKTHDEICDIFLQNQYMEVNQNDRPFPPSWEYQHLHIFLTYRVYYRGLTIDPNIFPAFPPRVVGVPKKEPENLRQCVLDIRFFTDGDQQGEGANGNNAEGEDECGNNPDDDEERRALLEEVRVHTDLLFKFEDVIPKREFNKRKRELFMAMPPLPLPAMEAMASIAANDASSAGPGGASKKRGRKSDQVTEQKVPARKKRLAKKAKQLPVSNRKQKVSKRNR